VRVSKVDVVVLGTLAEAPCHGYELRERMRHRGMDRWAAVGKASVYQCLSRLEREGLIAGRAQEGREGPDRRVYRMTGAGRARLIQGLEERFADPSPFETEAGVALGFIHLLGPAARRRALDARDRALLELREAVSAGAGPGNGGSDASRDVAGAMLLRQRNLVDAELGWLRDVRSGLSRRGR
jgi:DNA-binding PadR family transcriptional regulator